jgi:mono/diheme cytochrome c family protein
MVFRSEPVTIRLRKTEEPHMPISKKWAGGALAGAIVAATVAVAASAQTQPASPAKGAQGAKTADPRVARGAYLVTAGVCDDCHTPKKWIPGKPDPVPMEGYRLAGHLESEKLPPPPAISQSWVAVGSQDFTAWAGPWGISYSMNLTPDENTGIGSWSESTFVQAMRAGKHMGVSRPILPPMPWPAYGQLTDDDLKAIYAFLRTIPAVHNRIPDPVPPPSAPGASAVPPPAAKKP